MFTTLFTFTCMLLLTVTLGSDIGNIVQFNSKARGFDDFLGYLTGAEDYYMHTKSVMPTCTESNTKVDV